MGFKSNREDLVVIENTRYIKAKATLKHSNVTITENLKVEDHEYDYEVFEKWKSKLLVNCGFEHISEAVNE